MVFFIVKFSFLKLYQNNLPFLKVFGGLFLTANKKYLALVKSFRILGFIKIGKFCAFKKFFIYNSGIEL